jgi:hypothetical protein
MTHRRPLVFCWQYLIVLILLTLAYQKDSEAQPSAPKFVATPVSNTIAPGVIDEVSGIADSRANPGHLWAQQDGGNSNDIFLLSWTGKLVKRITIKNTRNRDWEDMTLGKGPLDGVNYIYLADIGDNFRISKQYFIYRFPEPSLSQDTVSKVDRIIFKYPDGSHNAEALLVDPRSRDIYVVTKTDSVSHLYKIAYPQASSSTITARYVGSLGYNGVVSAAISSRGDEIMIKTYLSINYWKRNVNESIEQALKRAPSQLNYAVEPQGEAVCFRNDGTGFFTLSERLRVLASVSLNFYKRK